MQYRPQRFPRVRASVHAVSVALGLTLAAAAPMAWAQSNTTTTIYGSVPAGQDTRVVLENTATGVQRSVQPDAGGRYRATSLPPGQYQVRIMRGDQVLRSVDVEAKVGSGVEASYDAAVQIDAVRVTAAPNRKIDVTSTNNGVILTAKDLQRLPVANDVASVIQLTPGTVRGTNAQYGNAPSIGGAGQSENSFYVNGFPVTNILTQVGAAELPFGAISNMQVLTGGYGAEFGRATGGIVNIATRSGGNEFQVGAKVSWTPESLRGKRRNTYWPNTGAHPDTDGKLLSYTLDNSVDSKSYGLYASGPIIRDKLFFFAAMEQTHTDAQSVSVNSDSGRNTPNGWSSSDSLAERYLAKIDFNLTDDHHFEFTKLYDRTQATSKAYGFDYTTLQRNKVQSGLAQTYSNCCGSAATPGANISIFKYTGYLSDDLTLTALYGDSRTRHQRTPAGYDPSLAQTSSGVTTRVPGLTYRNPQLVTGSLPAPGSSDKQKGGRLDVEYRLGKHSLRAGIDRMDIETKVGETLAGGSRWSYRKAANPNRPIAGAFQTPAQGGGFGPQGYYVSHDITNVLARPSSRQSAQYIQDLWQVTDNVLLDLGLRREQFVNYTTDGKAFIEQDNMLAPRLGVTWDYFGDGTLKLFANAGRYHLPVPSNLSSNMASPLLITSQYYTYTGVDPTTGAPTGLHAISDPYSPNNFYGQARDAREITAIDLKPLSQDEIALGFEKALGSDYILGASLLYRHLNETNDDTCDQRPIDDWAARNGVDTSHWHGFSCAIINPGRANSLWVDFSDGAGLRRVDISKEGWGQPKAHRIYRALNLSLEHPFSNRWYGRLDYTFSSLRGNTEGQVDTLGGGDVALTISSDHKELMYYANGYLPSDRRHALKAYGYFQVHPEVLLGGNFSAQSGAPRNCRGELPPELNWDGNYGSAYFFCDGQPAPRGSQGRMPWRTQFDANVTYLPRQLPGLSLKLDVFNLFDSGTVTRYQETHEDGGAISHNYLQVDGRQAARSVRMTAEFNWK